MANVLVQQAPGNTLRMATGTMIEGATAAAVTLDIGFRPRYVKVVNETDRTMIEWFEGMADAEGIVTVAAGTRTLVTANGITISGDTDTYKGFIFGLDTNVNVVSKQISFFAIG